LDSHAAETSNDRVRSAADLSWYKGDVQPGALSTVPPATDTPESGDRTMMRSRPVRLAVTLLLVLGAGSSCWAQAGGAGAVPAIRVPEGFVVEKVAGPPLVEHPMMACFDDRGRLFVAEAAGVNLRADDLLKDPPNRIRLLEDADGDGRYDRSTIFAD